MASGESQQLQAFLTECTDLDIEHAELLDVAYILQFHPADASREVFLQAIQQPSLIRMFPSRPDLLANIVDCALDDEHFRRAKLPEVVTALQGTPKAVEAMSETAFQRAKKAARSGDVATTSTALQEVFPCLAPTAADTIWRKVLDAFDDPRALSVDIRFYLLPRLAKSISPSDEAWERWLSIPSSELRRLLALDLPRRHKLLACMACLRHEGDVTKDFVRALDTAVEEWDAAGLTDTPTA